MSTFTKFVEGAKVVLKAAPLWISAALAFVTLVVTDVVPLLPDAWQGNVLSVTGTVIAVLTAALTIVRRVTPVEPDQRGILPQGDS